MTNTYYQNPRGRFRKEARETYQNLSEEEKDKRRKKTQERYKNFTEEETEKRRKKKVKKNLSEDKS